MKIKPVLMLLFLSLVICLSLQSQTVTNANQSNFTPAEIQELHARGIDPNTVHIVQPITNKDGQVISPQDVQYYRSQGWSDAEIANAQVAQPQTNQAALNPTPPDLKNAGIWMDNFLGMTNAAIAADVISMKPQSLKFRCYGQNYDYSGNYTVMLNTPRQHKNPLFGLGSPETAKFVDLPDLIILPNATIWEKRQILLTQYR